MRRLDPGLNNGSDQYIDGNPATGAGGTVLQAEPLNHLQEELAHVIEYGGGALDPNSKTQLRDKILAIAQTAANAAAGNIPLTDHFHANSEAAMLAKGAKDGDICVRDDLGGQWWACTALPSSNIANWSESKTGQAVLQQIAQANANADSRVSKNGDGIYAYAAIPVQTGVYQVNSNVGMPANYLNSAWVVTRFSAGFNTFIDLAAYTGNSNDEGYWYRNSQIGPWILLDKTKSVMLPQNTDIEQWMLTNPPAGRYDVYITNPQGGLGIGWWYLDLVRHSNTDVSHWSYVEARSFGGNVNPLPAGTSLKNYKSDLNFTGWQPLSTPSLGANQTYQDVTASRAVGVPYPNTTGSPILLYIVHQNNSTLTIGTGAPLNCPSGGFALARITAVVPAGDTVTFSGGVINGWFELRP